MLGNADLGVWNVLFDDIVRFFVRRDEGEIGAEVFQETFLLWRPYCLEIHVSRHDIWFIERDPKRHVVSESMRHFFREPREIFGESGCEHTAFFGEPEGKCPVPQGDEGFDISRAEGADDILIVCDFLLVEPILFRLDARPLDREAVHGVVQAFGDIEVFLEAMIMIDSDAGNIVLGPSGFCAKVFRPIREVTEF